MRVLVVDAFPDASRVAISEQGHSCAYEPECGAEQLPERVSGAEILVVRSTRVTAEALAAAESLRLVIRAGSGTNTIDRTAATQRGVYVSNVPGRNAIAVAELAFGLLLALDRQLVDNVTDLRAGRWNKQLYARARGVCGRRIGVVGLGRIGLAFAERAAAFGAEVYAVASTERDAETQARAAAVGIGYVGDLTELARTCDVLSFHLPETAVTRGLVGRELLAEMAPGTIVLNTSRGGIVDEDALIEAMDTRGVRAGLDVYADEPATGSGRIESRLARHPNVYGTHHIGASTEQAQQAVAAEVVRMIDAFDTGTVLHGVNVDEVRQAGLAVASSGVSAGASGLRP